MKYFLYLLIFLSCCGPNDEEHDASLYFPYFFKFGIEADPWSDDPAYIEKIVLNLVPVDPNTPQEIGPIEIKFTQEKTTLLSWECTGVLDGTQVTVLCPVLQNSEVGSWCGKPLQASGSVEIDGVGYAIEELEIELTCSEDPRRLDLLELALGENSTDEACAKKSAEFEEKFGWKDGNLEIIHFLENGVFTGLRSYTYNSDGTVANLVHVDPEGFVTSETEYQYEEGNVVSRTFTKNGVSDSCNYNHTPNSVEVVCPSSTKTATLNREEKWVERDIEDKTFRLSYEGEFDSLSKFLTTNPAQQMNLLRPIADTAEDDSVKLVYEYEDLRVVGTTITAGQMVVGQSTFEYNCN